MLCFVCIREMCIREMSRALLRVDTLQIWWNSATRVLAKHTRDAGIQLATQK